MCVLKDVPVPIKLKKKHTHTQEPNDMLFQQDGVPPLLRIYYLVDLFANEIIEIFH